MAGGLFGRSRTRIQELEETIDRLKRRTRDLEAEAERERLRSARHDERRKEAVAARQEAETRANRLEDRIAQLEGELDRLRTGGDAVEADPVAHRHHVDLRGRRLAQVLDRLGAYRTGSRGALTAAVREAVPDAVTRTLGARGRLVEGFAPCLVLTDDAGIVSLALRPPIVPDLESTWSDRFVLERDWFEPGRRYILVLARSDLFAAGVYEGDLQVQFKGLRPRVGRRHSRGGFSQGRFERIRDEQVADHVKRCREALKDIRGEADRFYLVGQRETIDALAKEFPADATATVDATGAPREALEDAFRSFWTTRMWLI